MLEAAQDTATSARPPKPVKRQADRAESDEPERRCIVSGTTADRAGMVRFVLSPDGVIVPDVDGKLPGRGIWCMADLDVVNEAIKRRAFVRAAKAHQNDKGPQLPVQVPVQVPDDLGVRTGNLIAARALNFIGLARGAGAVRAGFEKVREALEKGRVAVLIEASDGGHDGRQKLSRIKGETPVVDIFSSDELSLALGRENVIHAALAPGRLADRLVSEVLRLKGFRKSRKTE